MNSRRRNKRVIKRRRRRPQVLHMDFRVGMLRVRPGDMIVMITDIMLTRDQIVAIKQRFDEQLKSLGAESIIVSGGVKLGVLRPEVA